MKAVVYREYGSADVLKLDEIAKPLPGDNEVLLRVRAASVNPLDWRFMRGEPYLIRLAFGVPRPKLARPGRDVAGEVEAVGRNVTQFKPGDAVFGIGRGTLAEYACARATSLVAKPHAVTFEQAASLPIAGLTALQGLREKGRIQRGQRVLVNGAAGGVGTFAVQLAKLLGAEVTGVCSTGNVALVRSLGADQVIDYTQQDFADGGHHYDILLDCVGNRSLSACKRTLAPAGTCVVAGAPHDAARALGRTLQAVLWSALPGRRFVLYMASLKRDDLAFLAELVATAKLRPVLERRYDLSQAADAIRLLETGHARGKLIVSMGEHAQGQSDPS